MDIHIGAIQIFPDLIKLGIYDGIKSRRSSTPATKLSMSAPGTLPNATSIEPSSAVFVCPERKSREENNKVSSEILDLDLKVILFTLICV